MNSFSSKAVLKSGNRAYTIYRLPALGSRGFNLARLPFSLKILLENLLRREDGINVTAGDIEFLANWDAKAEPCREIAYMPARVLMQDFTGVPAVVDLAAMRDAIKTLGGDPERVNPLAPAELVIDHSVQVDEYGTPAAYQANVAPRIPAQPRALRLPQVGPVRLPQLLRRSTRHGHLPPGQSRIPRPRRLHHPTRRRAHRLSRHPRRHRLPHHDDQRPRRSRLGRRRHRSRSRHARPARLDARPAGRRLTNSPANSAKAPPPPTSSSPSPKLLRKLGVVGKFVEFYGPGIAELPLADRATIGNMAPEYGATCGIFPVDAETLRYLRLTGRSEEQIALVEAYYKEQGLFHTADTPEAEYYADPRARPRRCRTQRRRSQAPTGSRPAPQRRSHQLRTATPLAPRAHCQAARLAHCGCMAAQPASPTQRSPTKTSLHVTTTVKERFNVDPDHYLDHGSVVIAAITSCTNTSNPSVMIAAGLLAKKAVEKGLTVPPWVKTSLAPGSRVVTDYYEKAGLLPYLEKLRFNVVGYGCTTCIGNSGPLPADVSKSIEDHGLVAVSVLSRQSQLRGPRQRRRPRQLPHVAAARRRLRARRPHRPQLRRRPARQRQVRPARLPQRHLAHAGRSLRGNREGCHQ